MANAQELVAEKPQIDLKALEGELLVATETDGNGQMLLEILIRECNNRPDWHHDETIPDDEVKVPSIIEHALELMYEAHDTRTRKNGDVYVTHELRPAIRMVAQGASADIVATILIHDVIEEDATSVIDYLYRYDTKHQLPHFEKSSDPDTLIQQALQLLNCIPEYRPIVHRLDLLTNRQYPSYILLMPEATPEQVRAKNTAKHDYRAKKIDELIEEGDAELAWAKYEDTHDIITHLEHDFSKLGRERVQWFEKLIEKYTIMLDTWQSHSADSRPSQVTDKLIKADRSTIEQFRQKIESCSEPRCHTLGGYVFAVAEAAPRAA